MRKPNPSIHEVLDGSGKHHRESLDTSDREDLARYEEALGSVKQRRAQAPEEFVSRVMAALPAHPRPAWQDAWRLLWPERGQWLAPALAGAAVMLLLFVGVSRMVGPGPGDRIGVTFELHAPDAERVELVGSFNDWTPGEILLGGPDASGHWTATVSLPTGRHEYVFLVDGQEWVSDPAAVLHRPDGFGHMNAVLDL